MNGRGGIEGIGIFGYVQVFAGSRKGLKVKHARR